MIARAKTRKPTKCWELIEKTRNVHEIRFAPCSGGSERWVLLVSDQHWDNPKCDRTLLEKHYREAVEKDAPIISIGDFYCCMQGKWDKRADKDSLRPEHQQGNYLDALVNTAAKWHEPYKSHMAILGKGNHETSIYKYQETDLLERLAERIRHQGGIARMGGYSGWVRFMFARNQMRASKTLFYHHGFGGGGPVTKGLIDFNRLAEWADADIIAMGHIHTKTNHRIKRMRLNLASELVQEDMLMLRCSTYKDEFRDGDHGFHIEKGRGPRPLGGWWLRFVINSESVKVSATEAE